MRLIRYKITNLEVLERVDNLFTPNSNQCRKTLVNKIVLCKNSTKEVLFEW